MALFNSMEAGAAKDAESESRLKFIEVFNAMEAGAFEGGLCHDGGGSSEGRDPRGHRSHPSTLVQRLR